MMNIKLLCHNRLVSNCTDESERRLVRKKRVNATQTFKQLCLLCVHLFICTASRVQSHRSLGSANKDRLQDQTTLLWLAQPDRTGRDARCCWLTVHEQHPKSRISSLFTLSWWPTVRPFLAISISNWNAHMLKCTLHSLLFQGHLADQLGSH